MMDPHNVLKLLGVDPGWSYPIATDCPLCAKAGKLEIRSANHAHCRGCHFTGDLIELLAAKQGESLDHTIDELRDMALLDWDERDKRAYLIEREKNRKLQDLWKVKSQQLCKNVPGSIRGVLSDLNILVADRVVRELSPHICTLRQEDFIDAEITLPKTAKGTCSWWKTYTALAVPCWSGVELMGFQLFTTKGNRYLPVVEQSSPSNGFGLIPSFTDEFAVVTDNPEVALRLTFWSTMCNGTPTGFIFTNGARDCIETFRCGETVFWSPKGDLRHSVRALNTPGSRILDHKLIIFDQEKRFPAKGNWADFRYQTIHSLNSHQQLAFQLLDVTAQEARPLLTHLTIDPGDRVKVMAYTSGEDARHLERIFANTFREEAVIWNGKAITDTPEGWKVGGKVISAAKLHLDQIRPKQSGGAIATGTISYTAPNGSRFNFNFKEELSRITDNTGKWIQQRVLTQGGGFPHVERSWSSKLFEVAQQFHTPTPIMSDQVYGWDGRKLRMPCFAVDERALHATRSLMSGPGINLPAAMSQGEWEAFRSVGFCRVILALLGNLLRTRYERHGVGIMLTNEPHMVARLARSFGAKVVTNPSLEEIDEHGLDPMPLFTEWSDQQLTKVMQRIDGYKNIILSVDSRTAHLSRIRPDWLQLRVGEQLDYGALRSLFLLLPSVLRYNQLDVDSEMFYRDIADVIAAEIGGKCRYHKLIAASIDLDTHNCYKGSTAATRILELIFYGRDRGDLTPAYTAEGIVINKKEFLVSLANEIIPAPTELEITQRLRDARFLIDDDKTSWTFDQLTWDLSASLAT